MEQKIAFPSSRPREEYSGSPAPFATFLVLGILFVIAAVLVQPNLIYFLFIGIAIVMFILLPATVAINKEWEEAIVLRLGKFQRLVGPGFFFKWP